MRPRLREALKSAAIVLLLALMVYLAAATWLYDVQSLPEGVRGAVSAVASALGIDADKPEVRIEGSRAETYGEAVFPVSCAVTWDGGRLAALGSDAGEARRLFARLSQLLGEAVGSSGELTKLSRAEWQDALSGEGIYFALSGEEPLDLFALQLGVTKDEQCGISEILISPDTDGVRLYVASAGGMWSAGTSASAAVLSGMIDEFAGGGAPDGWRDGCLFSFERGETGDLLLEKNAPEIKILSASAPVISDADFNAILAAFGINPLTNYRYTTAGGTRRAVDVSRVLALDAEGCVSYRNADSASGGIEIDCSSDAAAIEAARRIASGAAGNLAGDAALSLRSFERLGENDLTVSFGYTALGLPVYSGGAESCAVFEIRGGVLVEAKIVLRRYQRSGGTVRLLPENRADFLADGECGLAYFDFGETAEPSWIVRD